jgi:hypothetical protein
MHFQSCFLLPTIPVSKDCETFSLVLNLEISLEKSLENFRSRHCARNMSEFHPSLLSAIIKKNYWQKVYNIYSAVIIAQINQQTSVQYL